MYKLTQNKMCLGFFTHTHTRTHTRTHRHLKGSSVPFGALLEWNTIYVSSLHKGFNHLASLRYHCSEQLLLSGGCETCGSITDSAGPCYCCTVFVSGQNKMTPSSGRRRSIQRSMQLPDGWSACTFSCKCENVNIDCSLDTWCCGSTPLLVRCNNLSSNNAQ